MTGFWADCGPRAVAFAALGWSMADIADELGTTKNAVIGFFARRRRREERAEDAAAAAELAAIEAGLAAAPPGELLGLAERLPPAPAEGGCRWVYGDPGERGWRWCNAPRLARSAYCAGHRAVCYVPAPPPPAV